MLKDVGMVVPKIKKTQDTIYDQETIQYNVMQLIHDQSCLSQTQTYNVLHSRQMLYQLYGDKG